MKRAQLEAMTLEELYQVALDRRIGEAPGLPRDALIDRLADEARLGAPASAAKSAVATNVEQEISSSAVARASAVGRVEAGTAADIGVDTGAKTQSATKARSQKAGVPSAMAPDRPAGRDPDAMAGLYLAQGEPARAADLYRELLTLHPDDEVLAAQLAKAEAAVRERAAAQGLTVPAARHTEVAPAPSHGEPMGMLDLEELPEAYGVDECEVIAKDPHSLFVYWEVTEQGLMAARRDLGEEASAAILVLRVFSQAGGEKGPERDSRDHGLDWNHGRRYFPSPRPGVRVRAAVGLVTPSGLFAPIAHSSQVRVPPTEPAQNVSTEWMEVRPGTSGGRAPEPIEIVTRGPSTGERGVIPGVGPVAAFGTTAGAGPTSPDHGKSATSSTWRWRPGSQG